MSTLLDLDEFLFQVIEAIVIEIKLAFQGSIRNPPMPLKQDEHLFKHLIEVHIQPLGDVTPVCLRAVTHISRTETRTPCMERPIESGEGIKLPVAVPPEIIRTVYLIAQQYYSVSCGMNEPCLPGLIASSMRIEQGFGARQVRHIKLS